MKAEGFASAGLPSVPRRQLPRLVELYTGHGQLRAVIEAVLEGRLGAAYADDPAAPRVACLTLGCYAIFGGDPQAAAVAAMVAAIEAPRELLFPDRAAWRARLHELLGSRLSPRPMQAFSGAGQEPAALRSLRDQLPDGFTLAQLDAAAAARLDADLEPHALQVFPNAEDFAAHGLGFAACHGEALACVASSYAISSRYVEVAIATHPTFRCRGLATAVAAAMMLQAREQGLEPCWNAANPVSQRLALRLGYRAAGICEVLFLTPDAGEDAR